MDEALKQIDLFLAKLFHQPIARTCSLTGKSNFFFARLVYLASLVCVWLAPVFDLKLVGSLLIVVETFAVTNIWPRLKSCEEAMLRGDTTMPYKINTPMRGFMFCMATVLSFTLLVLRDNATALSWLGVAGVYLAAYVATDYQGPRKSLARRALDWLKAHPIRFPALTPRPVPQPN